MKKVSKMPLISIIVPVYNVENYLRKCIDSLISQTYKNLEIILVDDGSQDKCPNICDEYKDKDSRIVVIHKNNGGLSDARNFGIKYSCGKYVTFVDSDDYVENDYIEYLYNLLKEENTIISVCGHYICYDEKKIKKNASFTKKIDKVSALNDILYDKEVDLSSWGKLYSKELFDDISFPKGKIFEDTATTYLLFDKCNYISVGEKCKYYYVLRNNSITTTDFNLKKMELIEMTKKMCNLIEKKYPELKSGCKRRLMWAYLSTYIKIIYTPKKCIKLKKKK